MAGLSNLTTGAPDADTRIRYQSAFLPMLAAAGTTVMLMNALNPKLMDLARACRNIISEEIFSW
jgi:hypothetical protein